MSDVPRRLLAEALGTALLLAVVIGSGIMAERLAGGNAAVALLANTLATVAALYVLLEVLGPVSGAHFNPAVSAVMAARGALPRSLFVPYVAAQLAGGALGAWLAHAMFDMGILQLSTKARTGTGQWIAEVVATAGLLLVILRAPPSRIAPMVACWIGAAYWFTASTSFANPAAAFGRMFSDSFAGIAPASVPGFVVAELIGACVGVGLHGLLSARPAMKPSVAQAHTTQRDTTKQSTSTEQHVPMNTVTIFHNPACGTSRNTLAIIRAGGIEPEVVEYLKTPPTKERLRDLIAAMAIPVRALLREKGTPYTELKLDDPTWSDEALLDVMLQHPILINRPIVVTPLGTRLCRPSEAVLEILPARLAAPFTKEDGDVIVDHGERRR